MRLFGISFYPLYSSLSRSHCSRPPFYHPLSFSSLRPPPTKVKLLPCLFWSAYSLCSNALSGFVSFQAKYKDIASRQACKDFTVSMNGFVRGPWFGAFEELESSNMIQLQTTIILNTYDHALEKSRWSNTLQSRRGLNVWYELFISHCKYCKSCILGENLKVLFMLLSCNHSQRSVQ